MFITEFFVQIYSGDIIIYKPIVMSTGAGILVEIWLYFLCNFLFIVINKQFYVPTSTSRM